MPPLKKNLCSTDPMSIDTYSKTVEVLGYDFYNGNQ